MIKKIVSLGRELEDAWLKDGYDETLFPALAAEHLGRSDLHTIEPWEIADWAISELTLPEQRDIPGNFGDPPITLFNAPRFHIDAYFWLEGTTSIHQHGFCGAFQVLSGSSIHSWYEFEEEHSVNVFMKTGKLSIKSCELIEKKGIQQILPGNVYIHSLFHLDQPSVTIVARTHKSPQHLPQYSYYKPGLAIDPFYEEVETSKKAQILSAAFRAGHENANRLLQKVFKSTDLVNSFVILDGLRPLLEQKELKAIFNEDAESRFDIALGLFGDAFPEFRELFVEIFAEKARIEKLIGLRQVISKPEHRFFLALLLNLENREQIFELVRNRFPDSDPKEQVLDWLDELSNTRVVNGAYENGIGIPGFGPLDVAVIEEWLDGKDAAKIADALNTEDDEDLSEKISASIGRIESSGILESLLK